MIDGNLTSWVRLNTHDGKSVNVDIGASKRWYYHPTDPSADVAALPVLPDDSIFDFRNVSFHDFLSDNQMGEDGIGIGDEVFIVGLFAKMEGNTKMLPIVRTGTIAMIPPPNERISVTWIPKNSIGTPAEMEGYLIEARSISGISGAPVFSVRMMLQNSSSPPKLIYVSHLLGLVTGHWDLPPDTAKPSANEPDVDGSDESNKPINMGIAIVTPAKKILETLNHPELVQRRIEGVFV